MSDVQKFEPSLNNTVVSGATGSIAITLGAGTAPAICFGTGAPSFAAPKGSLYLNVAGTTTNDRLYSCSVATGTWVAVTTAS